MGVEDGVRLDSPLPTSIASLNMTLLGASIVVKSVTTSEPLGFFFLFRFFIYLLGVAFIFFFSFFFFFVSSSVYHALRVLPCLVLFGRRDDKKPIRVLHHYCGPAPALERKSTHVIGCLVH